MLKRVLTGCLGTLVLIGLLFLPAYAAENLESENNNTKLNADKLNKNVFMVGKIDPGTDLDWFKFTLAATSAVTIDFIDNPDDPDDIYSQSIILRDSINNEIRRWDWWIGTDYLHLNAGTYYIVVETAYDNIGGYKLKVDFTPAHSDEINDAIEYPTSLTIDELHYANGAWPYEVDWYRVENPVEPVANTGMLLQIDLNKNIGGLEIYDADNNMLTYDQTWSSDGKLQYLVRLDCEYILLKVINSWELGEYEILATASGSEETNDSYATAIPIRDGESVTASLSVPGDFDYFKGMGDKGIYTLQVKPKGTGWTPWIELYNHWWWSPIQGTTKISWPACLAPSFYLKVDDMIMKGGLKYGYDVTFSCLPSDGCTLTGGSIYNMRNQSITWAFIVITAPNGEKIVTGPTNYFGELKELPAGEYTIKVTASNYKPYIKRINLVKGQSVNIKDIKLVFQSL